MAMADSQLDESPMFFMPLPGSSASLPPLPAPLIEGTTIDKVNAGSGPREGEQLLMDLLLPFRSMTREDSWGGSLLLT